MISILVTSLKIMLYVYKHNFFEGEDVWVWVSKVSRYFRYYGIHTHSSMTGYEGIQSSMTD